jgi:hypothetical protein
MIPHDFNPVPFLLIAPQSANFLSPEIPTTTLRSEGLILRPRSIDDLGGRKDTSRRLEHVGVHLQTVLAKDGILLPVELGDIAFDCVHPVSRTLNRELDHVGCLSLAQLEWVPLTLDDETELHRIELAALTSLHERKTRELQTDVVGFVVVIRDADFGNVLGSIILATFQIEKVSLADFSSKPSMV